MLGTFICTTDVHLSDERHIIIVKFVRSSNLYLKHTPPTVSELTGLKHSSTAVEATDVSGLHEQMYCGMCSIYVA